MNIFGMKIYILNLLLFTPYLAFSQLFKPLSKTSGFSHLLNLEYLRVQTPIDTIPLISKWLTAIFGITLILSLLSSI